MTWVLILLGISLVSWLAVVVSLWLAPPQHEAQFPAGRGYCNCDSCAWYLNPGVNPHCQGWQCSYLTVDSWALVFLEGLLLRGIVG